VRRLDHNYEHELLSTRMALLIDLLTPADWEPVRAIYQEGIETGNATFERRAPSWERWDAGHLPSCRLVAREGERVLGWATLSPVSGRCVYAGVAEVSVYVAEAARGRGVGRALMDALIFQSEQQGIWTLQAGVFPENAGSLSLLQRCGFRVVGIRERLGKMGDRWRDVVLLERRSQVAGAG
jgi:L-amino acid N-acyltransferase YncA